jgi:hypothetical protein
MAFPRIILPSTAGTTLSRLLRWFGSQPVGLVVDSYGSMPNGLAAAQAHSALPLRQTEFLKNQLDAWAEEKLISHSEDTQPAAKRTAINDQQVTSNPENPPGTSDWHAQNTEPLQRGLAELFVHPPARSANAPLEFPLHISLSFAECPDELENATLALTEATLVPSYNGCRPVPGTRMNEGNIAPGNLLFRGGNWRINGPRLPNNHLQGEPILSDPLCTIQCDGSSEDSLTLTLQSGYRALVVVPDASTSDSSLLKQRILQVFLQKSLPRDNDGIVIWGRATLRRKAAR